MSLIVKKFGGTSVGSIERIQQVAAKVAAHGRAATHQNVCQHPSQHVPCGLRSALALTALGDALEANLFSQGVRVRGWREWRRSLGWNAQW